MSRLQSFIATLLLLTSALASQSSHAQWFGELHTEAFYQDNLTRSEFARDAREDAALAAGALGGVQLRPGLYTGLTLSASVVRTQFRRYTGLSNTEAGLALSLSHKFGLGDRAPSLSVELGVARNEFNRDLRDAWIYRGGVSLQKRLTDTLGLRGGLRYERRDGDHDVPRVIPQFPRPGNAWDVSVRSAFVSAEQDLGAATWLSASYQFQDGDVVSTSLSYPKIFNTATAITLDPLYGPNTVAYRLPARVHSASLDLNRAVFETATLYLGFELQRTYGRNGIDYAARVVRGGFIHSF